MYLLFIIMILRRYLLLRTNNNEFAKVCITNEGIILIIHKIIFHSYHHIYYMDIISSYIMIYDDMFAVHMYMITCMSSYACISHAYG